MLNSMIFHIFATFELKTARDYSKMVRFSKFFQIFNQNHIAQLFKNRPFEFENIDFYSPLLHYELNCALTSQSQQI